MSRSDMMSILCAPKFIDSMSWSRFEVNKKFILAQYSLLALNTVRWFALRDDRSSAFGCLGSKFLKKGIFDYSLDRHFRVTRQVLFH
jgi:hypothetical protein